MADRVHPRDSPSDSAEFAQPAQQPHDTAAAPPPPQPEKPAGHDFIIHVPKDQVFRIPPPENARRYDEYTRRENNRRSRFCCCFCWLTGLIFILAVLIGIAAGIFYLVVRPEAPSYTIEGIAIKGINISSPSPSAAISPEFDVTVRADNPNDKIGIRYETDSSAEIFYKEARLCNGVLPAFYQPSNNVTVFETALRGKAVKLRSEDWRAMGEAQTKRQVPLTVRLRAPVRIKVGYVKSWKITVKVNCEVTVDKLTVQAKIGSRHCDYSVDLG